MWPNVASLLSVAAVRKVATKVHRATLQSPVRSYQCNSIRMNAANFRIVLVTAPDLKTARRLARAALEARLIACANLIPRIESHYRWQGKIERSAEVLLVLKTTKTQLARLEKLIVSVHPYDTPEFVILPLSGGNRRYLDWLRAACDPRTDWG
jgi:periplasmic divalent cation tolerance protein